MQERRRAIFWTGAFQRPVQSGSRLCLVRQDTTFGHVHKKQYTAKNFLRKDSKHIQYVYMAGDTDNNPIESFNDNTVRHREKVVWGLKKEDSAS